MNGGGLNGSDRVLIRIDVNVKESVYKVLQKKSKEFKITPRGLIVEIIEAWVSDVKMKARLQEEKDSKRIYTETPDPEPEPELEEEEE